LIPNIFGGYYIFFIAGFGFSPSSYRRFLWVNVIKIWDTLKIASYNYTWTQLWHTELLNLYRYKTFDIFHGIFNSSFFPPNSEYLVGFSKKLFNSRLQSEWRIPRSILIWYNFVKRATLHQHHNLVIKNSLSNFKRNLDKFCIKGII
jgi:hypothetical protein